MKPRHIKNYYTKLSSETLKEASLDHLEVDMDPAHKNIFRVINVIIIFLFITMTLVTNMDSINAYSLIIVILVFMFFIAYSLEKRFHIESKVHAYFRETSMYYLISVGFLVIAVVFYQIQTDIITILMTYVSTLLGCVYAAIAFERTFHLGIK